MDKLYEYIAARGGRITDRELSKELGMSLGAVSRGKARLKREGLIEYEAASRRVGTEYRLVQSGAKSGAKAKILDIGNTRTREREERARMREGFECSELELVLAAWEKYRGRVLIEDEKAEMASWREQLGEARLIELIALAWRRCTADRMSLGYFADYYVEPELRGAKIGAKKAEQKAEQKKWRKPSPAAAPIKETTPAKKQVPEIKRTGKEPWLKYLSEGSKNDGQGNLQAMSWATVPEGAASRAERKDPARIRSGVPDI